MHHLREQVLTYQKENADIGNKLSDGIVINYDLSYNYHNLIDYQRGSQTKETARTNARQHREW